MPNLTVTGETSREEIIQKMRGAHVMLMPSRFETFGWVYLEAMASGTIALASNQPPQREILANGTAGSAGGPNGERILSTHSHPLIAEPAAMLQLALRGQKRIADEYDPHVVARKFREFGEEAKVLFQADRRLSLRCVLLVNRPVLQSSRRSIGFLMARTIEKDAFGPHPNSFSWSARKGIRLRVAIVHHWFVSRGGGERVAECIASMFPEAEIFTLVATPGGIPATFAGPNSPYLLSTKDSSCPPLPSAYAAALPIGDRKP